MEMLWETWPLLLPLFLVNLALIVIALIDLTKRKDMPGSKKWLWGDAIVVLQYLGPIVYLVLGRKEE
jgi:hypothetical protein